MKPRAHAGVVVNDGRPPVSKHRLVQAPLGGATVVLEPLFFQVVSHWTPPAPILEPSGPVWGHLGPFWSRFGANLANEHTPWAGNTHNGAQQDP